MKLSVSHKDTAAESLGTNTVVLWDWLWPLRPQQRVLETPQACAAECTFWCMEHSGTQLVFYCTFSVPQLHSMAAVTELLLLRFKNLNLLFLFWVILVILLNDGLRLLNGKFLKGATPEYCDEILSWSCFVLRGMRIILLLRVFCWMWYGGDPRRKLYYSTLLYCCFSYRYSCMVPTNELNIV